MKFTSHLLAINKSVPQGSVLPPFHIFFYTNMLASLQYRAHWLNDGINNLPPDSQNVSVDFTIYDQNHLPWYIFKMFFVFLAQMFYNMKK